MSKKLKITQIKSKICTLEPHRRTLRALGLRRTNQSIVKEVNPAVLGMIASVQYLLKVEEVD